MSQATLDYATVAPPDPIPLPRRLAAEFVGTFALVFAGCGAIAAGVDHVGVAVAFGLTIMAMVIAVGDISGAHFNPAVSFAFAISRRMRGGEAVAYTGAQCAAAAVASLFVVLSLGAARPASVGATVPPRQPALFLPTQPLPALVVDPNTGEQLSSLRTRQRGGSSNPRMQPFLITSSTVRALVYEIILTFLLVFVILCVAIGSKERGLMAGIAIGGTIVFCALVGGAVSGASMNPARSLGPALFSGTDAIRHLWIYWTAPFLGSLIAVAVWTYIYRHGRPAVEAHVAIESRQ